MLFLRFRMVACLLTGEGGGGGVSRGEGEEGGITLNGWG